MSIDPVDTTVTVSDRPRWALVAAIAAILFGALTVLSGGFGIFGGSTARASLGDIVGFVLWSNFLQGFLYVLAGIGLLLWRRWGAQLAAVIAIVTLVVFAAFGWHAATGGAFEMRTLGAMILRSGFWIAIAIPACRALGCLTPRNG
jgi:hypothetical protein